MLKRVFPLGTILRDVVVEVEGNLSFGRQMGSYPILAGIPLRIPKRSVIDAVVVDWGMRSVTALPVPITVNTLPASALRWLPGIGKNNAARIIVKRPFRTMEAFYAVAGRTPVDHLIML
jgi:radical SAM superfamily enzyme with C-terminal helix-hairpin-helix motif